MILNRLCLFNTLFGKLIENILVELQAVKCFYSKVVPKSLQRAMKRSIYIWNGSLKDSSYNLYNEKIPW